MKEWLYRALRTFFQAASGYLAANLVTVLSDADPSDGSAWERVLCGLITAAVAAGIAAVMNRQKREEEDDES